jgi:hypothetical protein
MIKTGFTPGFFDFKTVSPEIKTLAWIALFCKDKKLTS